MSQSMFGLSLPATEMSLKLVRREEKPSEGASEGEGAIVEGVEDCEEVSQRWLFLADGESEEHQDPTGPVRADQGAKAEESMDCVSQEEHSDGQVVEASDPLSRTPELSFEDFLPLPFSGSYSIWFGFLSGSYSIPILFASPKAIKSTGATLLTWLR